LPTVACQDWSTIVHSAGLDLTDCGRLEQTSPERPEETRVFAIYSILMNNHHNAAGLFVIKLASCFTLGHAN